MHDVTRPNVAARNEHLVCDFVDVNFVSGNDVFDIRFWKPTPCYKLDSTYEMTRRQLLRYKSVTLKYVGHENAGYIIFLVFT